MRLFQAFVGFVCALPTVMWHISQFRENQMHGFFGHKGDTTSIFATPLSSPLCFFPVSGRSKDTAQMLKYKKRENLTFDFVEFGCLLMKKKC